MGDGGVGALSGSQAERPETVRDRSQSPSSPAQGGDAGTDQGRQDLRGSADCATGAPVSESSDGAPVETRAAVVGSGRLALRLLAELAGAVLRTRRSDPRGDARH